MVDAPKPLSRAELEQKIIALAWADETFRKAFLADPKGEFEKRLGAKLPAGLSMTAHAEDDNHLHFVIPMKPAELSELSEADLEKVAGGTDFISTSVVTVSAIVYGITGREVW